MAPWGAWPAASSSQPPSGSELRVQPASRGQSGRARTLPVCSDQGAASLWDQVSGGRGGSPGPWGTVPLHRGRRARSGWAAGARPGSRDDLQRWVPRAAPRDELRPEHGSGRVRCRRLGLLPHRRAGAGPTALAGHTTRSPPAHGTLLPSPPTRPHKVFPREKPPQTPRFRPPRLRG